MASDSGGWAWEPLLQGNVLIIFRRNFEIMAVVPFFCALDVVTFARDIRTATTKSEIPRELVLGGNGP